MFVLQATQKGDNL